MKRVRGAPNLSICGGGGGCLRNCDRDRWREDRHAQRDGDGGATQGALAHAPRAHIAARVMAAWVEHGVLGALHAHNTLARARVPSHAKLGGRAVVVPRHKLDAVGRGNVERARFARREPQRHAPFWDKRTFSVGRYVERNKQGRVPGNVEPAVQGNSDAVIGRRRAPHGGSLYNIVHRHAGKSGVGVLGGRQHEWWRKLG